MNGIQPRRIDWVMLGTVLLLIGMSVAFIFSAQYKSGEVLGDSWELVKAC